MECYAVVKNKIFVFLSIWMGMGGIVLCVINDEENKYWVCIFICDIYKSKTRE